MPQSYTVNCQGISSDTICLVVISSPIYYKHSRRQSKRHQLRSRCCQPHSVHTQKKGQRQHGSQHKHKGTRKCQNCRNYAVRQCGKHAAGKNIEANKKQCQSTDPVSVHSQFVYGIIRTGKYGHQRSGQDKRGRHRCYGNKGNNFQTKRNQLLVSRCSALHNKN